MLDCVYNGEVNIEQDQLDRFLSIAARYQLEGMISDEDCKLEEEDTHSTVENNSYEILPETENVDDVEKISQFGVNETIKMNSVEFQTVEELDEKIKENLSRVDGTKKWQCLICNLVSGQISNAKEHVEVHFEGLSFLCQNCDKSFRSRGYLRKHKAKCCNVISGPGTY